MMSTALRATYLESAEYHARLDPERYLVPAFEMIPARYCDWNQHVAHSRAKAVTLVAELQTEVVGFVDARLDQSSDAMHKEMICCHIAEIAVKARHRKKGIGTQLLRVMQARSR